MVTMQSIEFLETDGRRTDVRREIFPSGEDLLQTGTKWV